jgi:hypothetical protein
VTVADIKECHITKQFEELFPSLQQVREADEACRQKYKPATILLYEEDSPSVANLQWSLKRHAYRWTAKDQSHFLQVEGYSEFTNFDWPTRFSLDIQKLAICLEDTLVLSFLSDVGGQQTRGRRLIVLWSVQASLYT